MKYVFLLQLCKKTCLKDEVEFSSYYSRLIHVSKIMGLRFYVSFG